MWPSLSGNSPFVCQSFLGSQILYALPPPPGPVHFLHIMFSLPLDMPGYVCHDCLRAVSHALFICSPLSHISNFSEFCIKADPSKLSLGCTRYCGWFLLLFLLFLLCDWVHFSYTAFQRPSYQDFPWVVFRCLDFLENVPLGGTPRLSGGGGGWRRVHRV